MCFFSPNTDALTPLDLYLCANRTCEVGMKHATLAPHQSFLYALEELTRV
jgi:D-lactate dehydrogenase